MFNIIHAYFLVRIRNRKRGQRLLPAQTSRPSCDSDPRIATENRCDVIVMFAGERSELGKLIGQLAMGGIVERVLRATGIPLLLVRV